MTDGRFFIIALASLLSLIEPSAIPVDQAEECICLAGRVADAGDDSCQLGLADLTVIIETVR